MNSAIAVIMAIITYFSSLFTAIPEVVKMMRSKPDYRWLVTAGETVEHTYDEYYAFYQENLNYAIKGNADVKAEDLIDVTDKYQALLDENLEIAKKWRETPGVGQIEFFNHVKDGGPWDYKLEENHTDLAREWGIEGEKFFAVYGKVMEWEAFGNINFAYTGAATGFSPITIFTGGGAVEALNTGARWERLHNYFDPQDDHDLISFGLALYGYDDPEYMQQAKMIDLFLTIAEPRAALAAFKIMKILPSPKK